MIDVQNIYLYTVSHELVNGMYLYKGGGGELMNKLYLCVCV